MANAQGEEFKHFGMNLEFLAAPHAELAHRPANDPLHDGRHRRERRTRGRRRESLADYSTFAIFAPSPFSRSTR